MSRLRRLLPSTAPGRMERFVRFIVGGGIALVAGLWLAVGLGTDTTAWLVGSLLVVVGTAGLLYGIAQPLEYRR